MLNRQRVSKRFAPSHLVVALVSAVVTATLISAWSSVRSRSSSSVAVQLRQTGTLSRLQQPASTGPHDRSATRIQRGTDPQQLLSRVRSTTQQVHQTLSQLQQDLAHTLGIPAPQQQQQQQPQRTSRNAVPGVTVVQTGDALGGLPAQFLQQVLHAANYSQLGSAPLLDPLIPSQGYQPMKQAMRRQQDLFCRAHLQQLPLNGTRTVVAQDIKLHVYDKGDAVTDYIIEKSTWEEHVMAQLTWAMQQYDTQKHSKPPVVVDVGANLGWMTLSAAKMGANVLAFEGMPMNYHLLRRSLCDNPKLMARTTLFATGLSTEEQDCTVVSLTRNVGNGNVLCSSNLTAAIADLQQEEPGEFQVRGTMTLRRLDDLIDEDIHILKVDVEGHEEAVLQGAQRLLKQRRIKYLMTEVNWQIRSRKSLLGYVRFLYEAGFDIGYHGFQGPFLTKQQVYDPTAPRPPWDIFCVRREAPASTASGRTALGWRRGQYWAGGGGKL